MTFQLDHLMESPSMLGWGMLGIFLVTAIIIDVVLLLNKLVKLIKTRKIKTSDSET